jgi:hypothetical protein
MTEPLRLLGQGGLVLGNYTFLTPCGEVLKANVFAASQTRFRRGFSNNANYRNLVENETASNRKFSGVLAERVGFKSRDFAYVTCLQRDTSDTPVNTGVFGLI